jgi:hypothetical protein
MMDDFYDLDETLPKKKHGKRSSKDDILSDLRSITDDSNDSINSFLPSSVTPSEEEIKQGEYDTSDKWFNEMFASFDVHVDRSARIQNDLFEPRKKKKKHKDKDGKNDIVDYSKELDPESALLTNLLGEQNRFTESLQKEYDFIKSRKGSSRGITKQMTDLVENITEARSLSMQLVKEKINVKKLIAELSLKQHKEMGGQLGDEDINDFASNYLKQMLMNRNTIVNNASTDSSVQEYDNGDDMLDDLSLSLGDDSRPDEVKKYLKYENNNVEIFVVITDDDIENYEFIAQDDTGTIIGDYPLPNHTEISVNRSTNIATDYFGKKYRIIWQTSSEE